jgi:hypothetical protein
VVVSEKKERPAPRKRGTPSPPRPNIVELLPTLIINTTTKTISRDRKRMIDDEASVDEASLDIPMTTESRAKGW